MGIFRTATLCALLISGQAAADDELNHRIHQNILKNQDAAAVDLYLNRHTQNHDYEQLRNLAFNILERDARSQDEIKYKFALLGAAMSEDERAIDFFLDAFRTNNPLLQLVSAQLLCKYHNAAAEKILKKCMGSPYVLLRLEAAFLYAVGKYPQAITHIEALMNKLPDAALPLFPQMYALISSDASFIQLRKLLQNPDFNVRIAALSSISQHKLDRYTPYIRSLATQGNPAQLEAAANAIGVLQDRQSIPELKRLLNNSSSEVVMAAERALVRLREMVLFDQTAKWAREGNLYAIQLLGEAAGHDDLLLALANVRDPLIRANASLALLKRKHPQAPSLMLEWLSPAIPRSPLVKVTSHGKSLEAYKFVSGAVEQALGETLDEANLLLREEWLADCYDCGEQPFLRLAAQLIERKQNDLIPSLFGLLEKTTSPQAQTYLDKWAHLPGYPLVRNYALLIEIHRSDDQAAKLAIQSWIKEHWQEDVVGFRPTVNKTESMTENDYVLKPNETSRLFLDCLNTIVALQDKDVIPFLLDGLKNSHANLHPIFASLLIRSAQ